MNPWADVPSSIRYPLSFAIPFLATLLLTPRAAALARRLGAIDEPHGHKTHAAATPYLGGAAVAAGVAGIGVLSGGAAGELVTILACGGMLALLGFLDDVRGISPVVRLSFEAACGLFLWQAGIRAGIFDAVWADLGLTCLWVVAVTNAVNFIDNMDGVAAGVAAVSAFGLFAIAAFEGDLLVASFAIAVSGASLGFLRHNFPPARIFLGDAGSLLLGFLLAALGLQLDLVGPSGVLRGTIAALAVGVPLFDLGLVVASRVAGRRPVHVGGTDHSTHRLSARGMTSRRIALSLMGIQAICSGAAFLLFRAGAMATVAVAVAIIAAVPCAILLSIRREIRTGPAVTVAEPLKARSVARAP